MLLLDYFVQKNADEQKNLNIYSVAAGFNLRC